FITGYAEPVDIEKMAVSPYTLRKTIVDHIDAEIRTAKAGGPGQIWFKMNSLVDPGIIDKLYEASQAGVEIDMVIRGICCLRPGVPGLSENITVTSIIDRFLEHARILYFYHGGDERVFISSADWMTRNLDRRVELLVPILDTDCKRKVIGILKTCLRDNVRARRINSDGTYSPPAGGKVRPIRCQLECQRKAREAAETEQESNRTRFTPIEPQRM
ncbi:MAG: RNA degradosome polyphosphate kinase, partial [Planctomycetaceae bacterium]|nr:RNA degradosome polyphosphate kinase [Planctomycetaceae bacterium]